MLCQWVFILQRYTEALDHAVGRQLWCKLIHREDLKHSKYKKKQKLRMLRLFQMQAPLYGSILKDASQNPHADWVWSELLVLPVQWAEAALCHPSANAYPILPEVLGMRKLYEVFLFQRLSEAKILILHSAALTGLSLLCWEDDMLMGLMLSALDILYALMWGKWMLLKERERQTCGKYSAFLGTGKYWCQNVLPMTGFCYLDSFTGSFPHFLCPSGSLL